MCQSLTSFLRKKVVVKACILLENVVSLHRQSKEQPFVPCSGLLLRPTRVINDCRRRSSMKTTKTAGTGCYGELQIRTLKIQTAMSTYSIAKSNMNEIFGKPIRLDGICNANT